LRSAAKKEDLVKKEWSGPSGVDSYYTESVTNIRNIPKGQWIQYRALFDTDNGAYSPVLEAVEIVFE
jgi:hypothetical protein